MATKVWVTQFYKNTITESNSLRHNAGKHSCLKREIYYSRKLPELLLSIKIKKSKSVAGQ